jgi:hypothetical protein
MWFQRLYDLDHPGTAKVSEQDGNSAPEFSLPLLETGKSLRTSDLKGWPSLLCFVSPESAQSFQMLMPALHAWWHRLEGRVYLVCTGAEEPCRLLVRKYANEFPPEKIVYDEWGVLARSFRIIDTPQAVELDQDARVRRYGRRESLELDSEDSGRDAVANLPAWPDDRPMSGAGFARVDTKVSCVLSRFRLNSPLALIPFYISFRRVRRAARDIGGLLEAVFLLEGARTCYTLSLWKDDWSIVEFGRVRAHIDAANSVFASTYRKDVKRSEIWSAQFRLWAVSSHNLNWEGLDLQAALGEQWRRREELAQLMKEQKRA